MTMRLKEKELAAVGISLAAGCRPCTDYHLKAVRQAKAGDEEISRARRIAIGVRGRAAEIMAVHGLASGPAPYPLSQDRTALLIAIGLTGLSTKFVARTDIVAVKAFFLGLMRFDWQPLPTDPLLLVHLGLVAALMIIFPFSKLLHAPGVFFSPTRNQVDDSRNRRHLAH
ncbi:MAG: carboxymuconolactone decarboxylase family protein, partial [Alphaproteobacteria bacterium]|nr:carboxymuconolactone decarboxylase family protein [Alphaproteobacteria bacterium]